MTALWAAALSVLAAAGMVRWLPRVVTSEPQGDPSAPGALPSRGPGGRVLLWTLPAAAVSGAGAGMVAPGGVIAAALAVVAGGSAVLVVVDLLEHRLPDSVIVTALAAWLVGVVAWAALGGSWGAAGRSLLAGLAAFAVALVLGVVANGALGFGDVKLSGLIGAVLGWSGWAFLLIGFLAGVLLHGAVALLVLAVTRNPKSDVPMGPSLVLGATAPFWIAGVGG